MKPKRAGLRTDEEKRVRCLEVMRLHRAGYEAAVIARRTGTEVGRAFRWAQELGLPWTGKPVRVRKANGDGALGTKRPTMEGGTV